MTKLHLNSRSSNHHQSNKLRNLTNQTTKRLCLRVKGAKGRRVKVALKATILGTTQTNGPPTGAHPMPPLLPHPRITGFNRLKAKGACRTWSLLPHPPITGPNQPRAKGTGNLKWIQQRCGATSIKLTAIPLIGVLTTPTAQVAHHYPRLGDGATPVIHTDTLLNNATLIALAQHQKAKASLLAPRERGARVHGAIGSGRAKIFPRRTALNTPRQLYMTNPHPRIPSPIGGMIKSLDHHVLTQALRAHKLMTLTTTTMKLTSQKSLTFISWPFSNKLTGKMNTFWRLQLPSYRNSTTTKDT